MYFDSTRIWEAGGHREYGRDMSQSRDNRRILHRTETHLRRFVDYMSTQHTENPHPVSFTHVYDREHYRHTITPFEVKTISSYPASRSCSLSLHYCR